MDCDYDFVAIQCEQSENVNAIKENNIDFGNIGSKYKGKLLHLLKETNIPENRCHDYHVNPNQGVQEKATNNFVTRVITGLTNMVKKKGSYIFQMVKNELIFYDQKICHREFFTLNNKILYLKYNVFTLVIDIGNL